MFQMTHLLTFCVEVTNIGTCGTTVNSILVNMFVSYEDKNRNKLQRYTYNQTHPFMSAGKPELCQFSATT